MRLRDIDIGYMAQFIKLSYNGIFPLVITEAENIDGNTGTEINIFFTVHIINKRAFAVIKRYADPVIHIGNIFFIQQCEILSHYTNPPIISLL